MGVMDGMVPITILALGTEDHYDTVTKIQNGQVSILYVLYFLNILLFKFLKLYFNYNLNFY